MYHTFEFCIHTGKGYGEWMEIGRSWNTATNMSIAMGRIVRYCVLRKIDIAVRPSITKIPPFVPPPEGTVKKVNEQIDSQAALDAIQAAINSQLQEYDREPVDA